MKLRAQYRARAQEILEELSEEDLARQDLKKDLEDLRAKSVHLVGMT